MNPSEFMVPSRNSCVYLSDINALLLATSLYSISRNGIPEINTIFLVLGETPDVQLSNGEESLDTYEDSNH